MYRIILSVWPLLLAAVLLIGGNGMQGTLLALRATAEAFPPAVIGLIFSTYSFGFIIGCRYAAKAVAAVGHIRAFTAFASLASASALCHAVIVNEVAWLLLRIVTGFSFAAMQMILESWLNDSATNETRGKVLSVYRITDFTSVTAAQFILMTMDSSTFVAFAVISIAFSVALVPVALTRVKAPSLPATARLNIRRLWEVSPAAVSAVITVGLTGSTYWSMMPLLIDRSGYSPDLVGGMIGAIIFGGALSQYPFGRLSDAMDRRIVLVGCSFGAVVAAFFMPFSAQFGSTALIVNGLIFGGLYLPCYGIGVAHANDHAEPGTALSVNGGLLMLHGASAVVGPILVGFLVPRMGVSVVFHFIALVFVVGGCFVLYRLTRRSDPDEKSDYVAVSRTAAPAAAELDPRVEPIEQQPVVPAKS